MPTLALLPNLQISPVESLRDPVRLQINIFILTFYIICSKVSSTLTITCFNFNEDLFQKRKAIYVTFIHSEMVNRQVHVKKFLLLSENMLLKINKDYYS